MATKLHICPPNESSIKLELNQEDEILINLILSEITRLGSQTQSNGRQGSPIRAYFSQEIKIHLTDHNKRVLGNIPDLAHSKVRKILSNKHKAYLECGSLTYIGEIKFIRAEQVNGLFTIGLQFIGGNKNIFASFPPTLDTLPQWGCHNYNATVINATWQNEAPWNPNIASYYYSLKNFGGYSDYVPIEVMRPDFYIVAIIEQLAKYAGVRIKSRFLKKDWTRRLLLGYYKFVGVINEEIFSATLNENLNSFVDVQQLFPQTDSPFLPAQNPIDWSITDPLNLWGDPTFQTADSSKSVTYRFKFKIEVSSIFANPIIDLTFSLLLIGEGVVQTFNITSVGVYEFEFVEKMSQNTQFQLFYQGSSVPSTNGGAIVTAGSNFQICASFDEPILGLDICANQFMVGIETTKFLKGFVEAFNLTIMFDQYEHELIIEPTNSYRIPSTIDGGIEACEGFIKEPEVKDLTGQLDCLNSNHVFDTNSDLSKQVYHRWKDDSKDNRTDENTFEGATELNEKFKDGITVIENSFFAATINTDIKMPIATENNKVFIPSFLNFEEGDTPKQSFDFKPRLLFKVGKRAGEWAFGDPTNKITDYPLATMLDVENGVNLSYGDEQGVPGLLSVFRLKEFQIINAGKFLEVQGLMKVNDISKIHSLFSSTYWTGISSSHGRFTLTGIEIRLGSKSPNGFYFVKLNLVSFDV